jgi:hypothetical protein
MVIGVVIRLDCSRWSGPVDLVGMKLITVLNQLHKNYELGIAGSSRHNLSRFQTLDYQPLARRPLFPALALIACLLVGAVGAPAFSSKSQFGPESSRSADILSGRISNSIFLQARPNKLQSNISFHKKSVRAVPTNKVTTLSLRKSWFWSSASLVHFLPCDLSQGSGRSPPTLCT